MDKKVRSKRKKIIPRILIALVVLLVTVSIGGGTVLLHYSIERKTPLSADGKAWMTAYEMERLSLTVADGTELVGYYLAADKPSNQLAILVHGRGANAGRMKNYAAFYHKNGFNVFMSDNRAHDESGGQYMGMGWLDRLDYLAWLEMLIPKIGSDCEIVLHGLSMGASTVMMMSGEKNLPKQVKCIIEDCGYTSVEDEFQYQAAHRTLPAFPFLNIAGLESKLLAGYSFQEASALEQVKKTSVPIFFIHGGADDFVPTFMAYELYEAAAGEKELWIVKGAKHVKAYSTNPDEYKSRVKAFYGKYCRLT